MRSITKITLTLLCSLNLYGQALADGEAPISAVVLYPGSATIERSARVSVGMTQLQIKNLPLNFDVQTIRVQADPGIQIGQIVTQDIARTESVNAREAEIEARIQALEDQQAVLDVDLKSAGLVQKYLENFAGAGAAATDKQQPYIDAKTMSGIIESIRHGASDAFDRMQKVAVQKRTIGKAIDALRRELAQVRSGGKDSRNITINLAARQAGAIRLSYQVNRAGWKPAYRAMLDSAASTIDLERLAGISQKTGEDWSGVRLKLSTGQPRLSPDAPEPYPWLLHYQPPNPPPPPQPAYRSAYAPMPASAPAAIAGKSKQEADNYVPPVIETQGTFATEFEVPILVDLPADGREITVALSRQSFPVTQRVRVSPRLDASAVVIAEAPRPAGVWIAGNIQLFRDGNYVGATAWNPQSSERFMFPFGRDDLIRVTVDRVKDEFDSSGILNKRNERKLSDLYTIASFHKTPVDLLVLDSAPVSTSDEIKVELVTNPKPSIETWERRQGVIGWERSLAPNETATFSVAYTVTYPKEGNVSGLP